jgi:bacillithiol biosynthesis cysteine-adding enzyme BshC
METHCDYIPYADTNYFSKIVTDYLQQHEQLKPFYSHAVSVEGIKAAISERKKFPQERTALVDALKTQYVAHDLRIPVVRNIEALENENTFTVTTAHQPNIFTGPLYFINKILHTIKLSETLKAELPEYNFVPVYYMGSEDADLDELGNITIEGEQYNWNTNQTGAVGRMKVDKAFISLINKMEGQLSIHPFGAELIKLYRKFYQLNTSIQAATLKLVNELFGEFGLIIIVPDSAELKTLFHSVVEKELKEQFSHKLVAKTIEQFPSEYKVQAGGRELNLFYLIDDKRERIEVNNSKFKIQNSKLEFDSIGILDELKNHPERFSANVILRGVFQETILPNIAFIGGGGELAYWMELKEVFNAVNVPYPMLILRNSFLVAEESQLTKWQNLGFGINDLFKKEFDLMNSIVEKKSSNAVHLNGEMKHLEDFYSSVHKLAENVDPTLAEHVNALKIQTVNRLQKLEKKLLRAEKRKFETEQRQLQKIKASLFPNNSLQERVENFGSFYAKYGNEFIAALLKNSLALEQQFIVMTVK